MNTHEETLARRRARRAGAHARPRLPGGLHHRHRVGHHSARPRRGRRAPDLAAQGRARIHARMAPRRPIAAWLHHEGAAMGATCDTRRSTTRRSPTTRRRSRAATRPKSLDEVDPEAARDLREARHPAARARARWPASRSMRCSTRSRSAPPSASSWPRPASSSAHSRRRCRTIRTSCDATSARVVPVHDNFFAALNSAVFSDGSFVYVPKGVQCPMELSTVLPHQRRQDRAVRAHADHRRGRRHR